jgi:cytosine/adenosine deaminase-related metal-dependent hydrolase
VERPAGDRMPGPEDVTVQYNLKDNLYLVAGGGMRSIGMKLDQLGTVAAGKTADFLVLDANPLDNINNTRRIAKVYFNGKELDRAAMRAAWMH